MKTYDMDATEAELVDPHIKAGELVADVKITVPKQNGVAYVRIPTELRDFFKKVHDQNEVVGFEYDFDEAGLNFGVIVGKEKDNEKSDK